MTCAVPGVTVKLYNAVEAKDYESAKDIHFRLNALWNAMRHDNLPACVKYVQHRQGLPMFHPRAPMERVSDEQKKRSTLPSARFSNWSPYAPVRPPRSASTGRGVKRGRSCPVERHGRTN
ncbi:dihydrodipicolinate synthase family protein (plasmid) [Devosia sp. A8/3-2]|nr:dihydrodipicolinate synthase family protein [Devosia sp. A8/3-2]